LLATQDKIFQGMNHSMSTPAAPRGGHDHLLLLPSAQSLILDLIDPVEDKHAQ
jgi:hypothetical protein